MKNFKVRCIDGNDSCCFTKGNIYEIKGGFIIDDDGGCHNHKINTIDELNNTYNAQFELYEDTKSKPKLCEILGVEIDESFNIEGYEYNPYTIDEAGFVRDCGTLLIPAQGLCDIINNPEKIVRKPKFSDDDKALMRLYVNSGYIYAARDKDNIINMYNSPPTKCTDEWSLDIFSKFYTLPDSFLPQIKWSDPEPFNMAEYLKGLS